MQVRMAEFGEALGTRPFAVDLRSKVEARITASRDPLIVVDLQGVKVFSLSFADALFAELVERTQKGRYGTARWIAFIGANEDAVEHLGEALGNAHLAAVVVTEAGKPILVGAEPRVRQTFEIIERSGDVTSAQLRSKLKTRSPQAVNNWLAQLVAARVIEREQVGKGSGRPYVYRARTPQLVGAGGR